MNRRKERTDLRPDVPDEELTKHSQAQAGPTMIFVTVTKTLNGKPWTKDDFELLSYKWRELMFSMGVEAQVYQMAEDTVLVAFHSGWRGFDVKEFLLKQEHVVEIEWDSQKYYPEKPATATKNKPVPKKRRQAMKLEEDSGSNPSGQLPREKAQVFVEEKEQGKPEL
jgi:Chaperone for wingless signalling and trafficking of LDL receptor